MIVIRQLPSKAHVASTGFLAFALAGFESSSAVESARSIATGGDAVCWENTNSFRPDIGDLSDSQPASHTGIINTPGP